MRSLCHCQSKDKLTHKSSIISFLTGDVSAPIKILILASLVFTFDF